MKAVDEARLRDALATRQSAKLPWGRKASFDRARFDADLKRIQAFYADRGYPDARVTGFDVKLNDKQDAVDITVTIAEGEPVRVAAIKFVGFDDHSAGSPGRTEERRCRSRSEQPRDRQLVVTTHELALNELRDHGYPYAKVDDRGRRRPRRKDRDADVHGRAGQARVLRSGRDPGEQDRQRPRDRARS